MQHRKEPLALKCAWFGGLALACFAFLGAAVQLYGDSFVMRSRCRERQHEAKDRLERLYTAEQDFHARYGTYTSDIRVVRPSPDPGGRYQVGFVKSGPGATPALPEDDEQLPYDEASGLVRGVQWAWSDTVIEKDRFRAVSFGYIRDDATGFLDIWTIDERHRIANIDDGCVTPWMGGM
jgi:hypothetical protein